MADARAQIAAHRPELADSASITAVLACIPEFTATYVARQPWADPIYDARILEPGRLLLANVSDSRTRAIALASMAAAARAFDWKLTADLAAQAYAAADSAHYGGVSWDDLMWTVIDFMESELGNELYAHTRHLEDALVLYRAEHDRDPPWTNRDSLWACLKPLLPNALSRNCRASDAADLSTNRLLTTPGVRPRDDSRTNSSFGTYRPRQGSLYDARPGRSEPYPLDSPEHVLMDYAFAYNTRDIELYATLFDREFEGHMDEFVITPTTRDQEIMATRRLFEGATLLEMRLSFELSSAIAGPSSGERRIIEVEGGHLLVGTGEPQDKAVDLGGVRFVLQRSPERNEWKVVAQVPAIKTLRRSQPEPAQISFPVSMTLGPRSYFHITSNPPRVYGPGHVLDLEYTHGQLIVEGEPCRPTPDRYLPTPAGYKGLCGNVEAVTDRLPDELAKSPDDPSAAWVRAIDYWHDLVQDLLYDVKREYFLDVTERGVPSEDAAQKAAQRLRLSPLLVLESIEIVASPTDKSESPIIRCEIQGLRKEIDVELRATAPERDSEPSPEDRITREEAVGWAYFLYDLSTESPHPEAAILIEMGPGRLNKTTGRPGILRELARAVYEGVIPEVVGRASQ
ncbi:MAG: hypothetical protein A49_01680 [Methyloceanibacter sp.]|nr:MAG: hypothetical protein A49_01680 [Methyloceanibacter sp.]